MSKENNTAEKPFEDSNLAKEEKKSITYGYFCAKCGELYCSSNVHLDCGLDGKLYCLDCYWSIKHK